MPMKPDCEPLELLELERDRAIRTAAGSELEHTPGTLLEPDRGASVLRRSASKFSPSVQQCEARHDGRMVVELAAGSGAGCLFSGSNPLIGSSSGSIETTQATPIRQHQHWRQAH